MRTFHLTPKKAADLHMAAEPKTEVRSFLATVQYTSTHIKDFAPITEPCERALTKQGNDWQWEKNEVQASNAVKVILAESATTVPKNLQHRIVEFAQEGHQDICKSKALLRTKVWFPTLSRSPISRRPGPELSIDSCGFRSFKIPNRRGREK